jgi:DNA-binding SARP family transcriptional activator
LIEIGSRTVPITQMRRKPASVLIYLVTRPGFVANREEIIDDLWPEADPVSGTNNLNQSLYFLRREIDPWYDDDVSVDYVGFQGDLVWLERDLVTAHSASFVAEARSAPHGSKAVQCLSSYGGRFAPEFEYEEWADGWRARVHSTFLELANSTIEDFVRQDDLSTAVSVAAGALEIDPEAADIERRLVWLYGRSGQQSAARVQHAHLMKRDEDDELESIDLVDLLAGPLPNA